MKRAVMALALVLLPVSGRAQPSPDVERFRNLTASIASEPRIAGQWVVLLPAIAERCEMTVDREKIALLANRFDDPGAVDAAADYFASALASPLQTSWDAIAKRDQNEACRLADGLWGEAGTQWPGALRDMDTPGRTVAQHDPDSGRP